MMKTENQNKAKLKCRGVGIPSPPGNTHRNLFFLLSQSIILLLVLLLLLLVGVVVRPAAAVVRDAVTFYKHIH